MKAAWKLKTLLVVVFAFSFTHSYAQSDEWIRIQSDDGEFSIQTPKVYDAFYDKSGFTISDGSRTLLLHDLLIFNSYQSGTLLSFESYSVSNPAGASEILRDSDRKKGKSTEYKLAGGTTVKQILIKNENYFCKRLYITSKNRLYILTVASRNGETSEMKRFLDSLAITQATKTSTPPKTDDSSTSFSALRITAIKITVADNDSKPTVKPPNVAQNLSASEKLIVVSMPRPHFTDDARAANEQGTISLGVAFTENGGIDGIEIRKELKQGLLRQAVFAALRLKVLPPEKDGKPVKIKKSIEYTFSIF